MMINLREQELELRTQLISEVGPNIQGIGRAWLWNTDRTSVIPDHCPKELTLKWLRTLELLDMQNKNKPVEELVYLKLGME